MIIRIEKNRNYKPIRYDTALADKNLTWKAKGVWAYLMSMADNWQVYLSEVETHSADGKATLSTAIDELTSFRYVSRRRVHIDGRFKHYEYTIYEKALTEDEYDNLDLSTIKVTSEVQKSDSQTSDFQTSGNQTLTNKNLN